MSKECRGPTGNRLHGTVAPDNGLTDGFKGLKLINCRLDSFLNRQASALAMNNHVYPILYFVQQSRTQLVVFGVKLTGQARAMSTDVRLILLVATDQCGDGACWFSGIKHPLCTCGKWPHAEFSVRVRVAVVCFPNI